LLRLTEVSLAKTEGKRLLRLTFASLAMTEGGYGSCHCRCEHFKGAWQSQAPPRLLRLIFASLAMTEGKVLRSLFRTLARNLAPRKDTSELGIEKGDDLESPPFGNSGLARCYHTRRVLKMSTITTITRTAPMAITTQTHTGVGGVTGSGSSSGSTMVRKVPMALLLISEPSL